MGHCVSCFRMIDTICDEKEKDKLADIPSKKDDVIDTVGSVPERAVPLATVSMNHPLLADGPAAKEGATAARPPSRFLKAKKAESTRSYDTSNMISETEELLDSSSSNGASLTDREVMEGVSRTAVGVAAEAVAETAQRISGDSSLDDSLDSDDPKHMADTATESSADTFARCAPPGLTPDSEIVDSTDERLSENGSGGEKRADSPLSSADTFLPTSCPPPPGLDISSSGDTVPNPFVLDDDVPPPHLPQRSQESRSPKAADSADANGPSPAPLTTPSASISPPPGLGFKECSAERAIDSKTTGKFSFRTIAAPPPGLDIVPVKRFAVRKSLDVAAPAAPSTSAHTTLTSEKSASEDRVYSRRDILRISDSPLLRVATTSFLLPKGREEAYVSSRNTSVSGGFRLDYDSVLPPHSPERLLFDLMSREGSWLAVQKHGTDSCVRDTNFFVSRLVHHIVTVMVKQSPRVPNPSTRPSVYVQKKKPGQ